MVVEAVV